MFIYTKENLREEKVPLIPFFKQFPNSSIFLKRQASLTIFCNSMLLCYPINTLLFISVKITSLKLLVLAKLMLMMFEKQQKFGMKMLFLCG